MKLWEALKIHEETGRKIRPMSNNWKIDFFSPLQLDQQKTLRTFMDVDWQVEPAKVEVTREQVVSAIKEAIKKPRLSLYDNEMFIEYVCKELNL